MTSDSNTPLSFITNSYDPAGCELTSVAFLCPIFTSSKFRISTWVKLSRLLFSLIFSVLPMNPLL